MCAGTVGVNLDTHQFHGKLFISSQPLLAASTIFEAIDFGRADNDAANVAEWI